MTDASRVIWIRASSAPFDQEQKIHHLLTGSTLLVLDSDQVEEELMIGDGDLIIVNATGTFDDVPRLLTGLLNRPQRARILVRCDVSTATLQILGKFGTVGVLDAQEGPDLTRARVIRAGSDRLNAPTPMPHVPEWRKSLVGRSQAIEKVAEVIRLVGPRRCTVLITGETGTGKEVAARAIHRAGPRANGQFVAINCGAVPAALLEAELFGHTRGAFTGAVQVRTGLFEQAEGGTILLDEIGDMPFDLQAKLLRVLQERQIQKLGSSETVVVNARVIAATNCNLLAKVKQGAFREDLYYRLNVVPLELPPLRARTADVRPLGEHFLSKICREEQLHLKHLTQQAWSSLEGYAWPGNVRQLENAIASAVILSEDRSYLDEHDFTLSSPSRITAQSELLGTVSLPDSGLDFTRAVNELERELLSQALRKTRGNKKAAAEMLRLKRTTLSAKVRVLDLEKGAA